MERPAIAAVFSIIMAFLASGCLWGVVRDANTGAPVSGAVVSYTDNQGHTASTTTNANGFYSFDSASGPAPAVGPALVEIGAPGYEFRAETRLIEYNDNPSATFSNLSSFWEAQHFGLAPLPGSPPPPPPPPNPTATPTSVPPPGGGGSWGVLKADLAITDIFQKSAPVGWLFVRITNNGPGTVSNVQVGITCSRTTWTSTTSVTDNSALSFLINLQPGQTGEYDLSSQVDTSKYFYTMACQLNVPFNDPNLNNNSYSETIP